MCLTHASNKPHNQLQTRTKPPFVTHSNATSRIVTIRKDFRVAKLPVAIDENQAVFSQNLMGTGNVIVEICPQDSHADLDGGGEKRNPADIILRWMAEGASRQGRAFNPFIIPATPMNRTGKMACTVATTETLHQHRA